MRNNTTKQVGAPEKRYNPDEFDRAPVNIDAMLLAPCLGNRGGNDPLQQEGNEGWLNMAYDSQHALARARARIAAGTRLAPTEGSGNTFRRFFKPASSAQPRNPSLPSKGVWLSAKLFLLVLAIAGISAGLTHMCWSEEKPRSATASSALCRAESHSQRTSILKPAGAARYAVGFSNHYVN